MTVTRQAVTAAAGLVALGALASCTSGEPAPAPTSAISPASSDATGREGEAAEPGEQATAYPVAGEATPAPVPDLETIATGEWTLTLNGVDRVSDQALLVTATMTSNGPGVFRGFEEPGYSLRMNDEGKLDNTYEFSAITLTAGAGPAVYQVMRDANGICACSQGVLDIEPGQPTAVFAYVTAPAEATTVDVTVAGIGTFTGLEVQA